MLTLGCAAFCWAALYVLLYAELCYVAPCCAASYYGGSKLFCARPYWAVRCTAVRIVFCFIVGRAEQAVSYLALLSISAGQQSYSLLIQRWAVP